MNLNKQLIRGTLIRYFIYTVLLGICVTPVNLKSQDISTVKEIYNFEIGDIFHFDFDAYGPGFGMSSVTNIEIIDFYYSQNNDTVYYVRDIDYKESSSENPQTTYEYYIDTIYYTNLDSLIHSGFIDSVYTNGNLYNGRTINYVSYGNDITWVLSFVTGCGLVKTDYNNWWQDTYSEEKLVYYKKGEEEWGTPKPVSVESINANAIGIDIFPNPSRDYINIRSNDLINSTLTITSLSGNKIETVELFKNLTSIDISNLNSGIYIISIKKDEQIYYKKFMKK